MTNMTGQGKYELGLELEAEGLTGDAIAKRLGLNGSQGWYAIKHYYRKKADALNARAAGDDEAYHEIAKGIVKPEAAKERQKKSAKKKPGLEPVPKEKAKGLVEATLAASDRIPVKPDHESAPKPAARLTIENAITAVGEALRYRISNNRLIINLRNNTKNTFSLSVSEAVSMVRDLQELLQI